METTSTDRVNKAIEELELNDSTVSKQSTKLKPK
jgi:hypothetical protein